jgi:hypothetical protein
LNSLVSLNDNRDNIGHVCKQDDSERLLGIVRCLWF